MFPDATTKLILRLCLAGIALCVLWFLIATPRMQLAAERQAHADTKAAHAEVLRDLADRTAAVAIKIREREAQFAVAASDSDATHAKEKADALAAKDRVIAELRAGNVQLRHWWQDRSVSCADDAASPADPGGDAENSDLRAASAGRIVGAGKGADAWIGWLQRELITTRALCGMTQ